MHGLQDYPTASLRFTLALIMSAASPPLSRAQFAAMRCLAIDSVTADVASKFQEAGIRTLLLKGASIAQWLYRDGETRTYGDVDLLVSPDQFDQAERILEDSGFRHLLAGAAPEEIESTHGWLSPGEERVTVELHRTFHHIGASDDDLWREFTRSTERIVVAGHELEMPSEPSRCLMLALHVSRHGREFSWPLRDLTLAVEQVPTSVWMQAASMALRLDARPGMVSGLKVVPCGQRLCSELDLSAPVPAALVIEAENMSKVTRNLERLASKNGLRAKAAFALRKLFPTPAWMRYEYQLGDSGLIRLAWTYLLRLLKLGFDLPMSLLAWRRARRQARIGLR